MEAYIYQSALLCETCAVKELHRIRPVADGEAMPGTLYGGDSDKAPYGPLPDGGGESDCPEHCDHCGVFLENPLTSDGYAYVRSAIAADPAPGRVAVSLWAPFYL
jgi:hypothetical protein